MTMHTLYGLAGGHWVFCVSLQQASCVVREEGGGEEQRKTKNPMM